MRCCRATASRRRQSGWRRLPGEPRRLPGGPNTGRRPIAYRAEASLPASWFPMLSENANQKREGGIAKFWHTDWLVRMRRKRSSFWFTLALALFADSAWAQLPDGPGKEETQ